MVSAPARRSRDLIETASDPLASPDLLSLVCVAKATFPPLVYQSVVASVDPNASEARGSS